MLDKKAIERPVLVVNINHVVAVVPLALRPADSGGVFVYPVNVNVTRHIEPVTPPTLAKVMRGQKLIYDTLEGVWTLICKKTLHRVGLGKQSNEVQVRATNECTAIRLRREIEALIFEATVKERIERRSSLPDSARRRNLGSHDRSESPVVTVLGRNLLGFANLQLLGAKQR